MQPKSTPSVGYAELKAFLAKRRESQEQRRETRYQTNDAVEVEMLQAGFQRVAASIVDISRSGLCLLSESTIGKGSQVKITLEKQVVIFGEVQYCRPARGGFHSGIVIQDVFYPSRQPAQTPDKNRSRMRGRV
ncbi:MAG TPA: PilZ domain-containing protein [Bryobacteraceae bacterium]|nr:PilZ domain-containing protein [Bryobacteraceae bacterium]